MATQLTSYQCPNCTGPLHFVGESGKLECDYCGTSYDVTEIEALYAQKDARAAGEPAKETAIPAEEWDREDLKAYTCPACGAELICDKSTAATTCPYCGNPTVVPGQLAGALKPEYVIPFRLSHDDAVAALKKHYRGKLLLPKAFCQENHLQQIQGVYVPFWLFDSRAEGSARFQATRSHTHRHGDEEITRTEHFSVYRAGYMDFCRIPVDASTKMPDDYMDSLEPFDYGQLKPFSNAYLPGFLADRYDVSAEDCAPRADSRCQATLESALRDSVVGYDTCTPMGSSLHVERGKTHYALLPVWLLTTRWREKTYLFAMNGQTGRLVGDLPVSWGRFWGIFAAIALPLSILGSLLALL